MGGGAWLTVLQIAAGGSLVQILLRLGAFLYRRVSRPEERKATVSADATSVETAADVLVMVRGELREVRAQHAVERAEWEATYERTLAGHEALRVAQQKEGRRLSGEIVRLRSQVAHLEAEIEHLIRRAGGGDYGR